MSKEIFSLLFKTLHVEKVLAFYTSLFKEVVDEKSTTSYLKIFDCSLALPFGTVVVLRSQRMRDTLSFYQQVSSWKEEKHGNGPVHFSSQWGDTVVEIYPQRKKFPTTVELVIPVSDLAITIENLKNRHFVFLQESSTSALLQDPDQRLVQLLESSV